MLYNKLTPLQIVTANEADAALAAAGLPTYLDLLEARLAPLRRSHIRPQDFKPSEWGLICTFTTPTYCIAHYKGQGVYSYWSGRTNCPAWPYEWSEDRERAFQYATPEAAADVARGLDGSGTVYVYFKD